MPLCARHGCRNPVPSVKAIYCTDTCGRKVRNKVYGERATSSRPRVMAPWSHVQGDISEDAIEARFAAAKSYIKATRMFDLEPDRRVRSVYDADSGL